MLIDCCAMEKMFNRPCSFDGGAFDNFTDSCRWFQIDPLITTLFISIRFLADLLHSLSPHCYAQVLRTAGMAKQSNRDWRDCKAILSSFSSPFSPWSTRADGAPVVFHVHFSAFQCLHYQAERLCRLNPVYQESSQVSSSIHVWCCATFTASNCQHRIELVTGQLHREFRSSIQHCAQAAVEST